MNQSVIHGDCTVVLRDLARSGLLVDAVCTDPPYHLASIVARLGQPDSAPIQSGVTGVYARSSQGFMGQQWDGGDVAFRVDTWRRVYDVMKPGAYLVAFAATKGYHRMACAIEDAGFEIRDMLSWLYGTGFPKSHNLDGEHEGWGTALKPAVEPIVFVQKPISENSIEANVRRWGVGAIHIDACRIGNELAGWGGAAAGRPDAEQSGGRNYRMASGEARPVVGRWPANVLHDGSDEVLEAFAAYGERGASAPASGPLHSGRNGSIAMAGHFNGMGDRAPASHADSGTAARFFYSSKATQGERIFECRECGAHSIGKPSCGHTDFRTHPTVKPISLMEWLVRLICPPGGLVLDPFAGTGTMAAAARAAGMQSLSIEADENHVRDIAVRLGIDLAGIINAKVAPLPISRGSQGDMFL